MGWLQHFWFWIEIHTGISNESSPYYGFFSGVGSDLQQFLAFVVLPVTLLRNVNCHHKGCWRPFRHTTSEGFRLCKKHIGMPRCELTLHEIHEDHR